MKLTLEKIPTYIMPFFINGDVDGYTEEDINDATEWLNTSGVKEVILPSDEDYQPYFSCYPAFGKPCDVVDCQCVLEW